MRVTSFFKIQQSSDVAPSLVGSPSLLPPLHRAFRYEEFSQLDDILENITLDELMQVDSNGHHAWNYPHIPDKELIKIIKAWISLTAAESDEAIDEIALPDNLLETITSQLSTKKVNSIPGLIKRIEHHQFYQWQAWLKEKSDKVNNHLSIVSMMLMGANLALSPYLAFIDNSIDSILPLCIFLSGSIRIYEIYIDNKQLTNKHIMELAFIAISFALTVASFVLDSSELLVIGAVFSIFQSVFELSSELDAYRSAPENTERKMAHKQECMKLIAALIVNAISLFMVGILLSHSVGMVPLIASLGVIMLGYIAWSIMPVDTKKQLKTACGFGKTSYIESSEKEVVHQEKDLEHHNDAHVTEERLGESDMDTVNAISL